MDNKQLEGKGVGKTVKCCFKIYNSGQQNGFARIFFFEVMTIIQMFLRGLGKLNVDPFTWLGNEISVVIYNWGWEGR